VVLLVDYSVARSVGLLARRLVELWAELPSIASFHLKKNQV
jgi:hypothetical protein